MVSERIPAYSVWGDALNELIHVAEVRTPDGVSRQVCCASRPTQQEVNLLFVLCEHTSRVISMDDICHRMGLSVNAVRVTATKLRKRLEEHWTIQSVQHRGMRLVYIDDGMCAAPRTFIELDPSVLGRSKWKMGAAGIEKIRQAVIARHERERAYK